MKKYLISFCFLTVFATLFSYGQSDKWAEGYIIDNNNDTVYGLTKKRKHRYYYKVDFKERADGKKKLYMVEDLKAYKWGDELYDKVLLKIAGLRTLEAIISGKLLNKDI